MRKTILLALVLLPSLSFTELKAQDTPSYVLNGTIVTPNKVISKGAISVSGSKIAAVGTNLPSPPGWEPIETDSFIFPGLLDLHDHLTWNLFPRWKPNLLFSNRYEWQQLTAYKIALDTPHRLLFAVGLGCEMNRFGEIKAIMGGATSVVGSLGPSKPGSDDNKCVEGLARNLDFYSGFYAPGVVNAEKLKYEVFPLRMSRNDSQGVLDGLANGDLKAFIIHLAEGKPTDASSAGEYQILKAQGFLRPGVTIIHGIALSDAQFEEMGRIGVGLIWSPRSNIELYGSTADVAGAKRRGVKMAVAPDWSPSGSDGMLQELKYAATWNAGQNPPVFDDAELVRMATVYPAQLAGLGDKIGTLAPGYYADLLLIKRRGDDPYRALLHADVSDIQLVVVGGNPVYGDPRLMQQLLPGRQLDLLTVCGEKKALFLGSQASFKGVLSPTWNQTSELLASALREWGSSLGRLVECQR